MGQHSSLDSVQRLVFEVVDILYKLKLDVLLQDPVEGRLHQ